MKQPIQINGINYIYDQVTGGYRTMFKPDGNIPITGINNELLGQATLTIASDPKPKDLSFGIKVPLSLVPPTLVRQIGECMKDGASKRSPYNWRQSKISAMQTLDKILRHVYDCLDGKDLTDDTKLSNLAAAAANIGVYLDAQEHNCLIDDRPSKLGGK